MSENWQAFDCGKSIGLVGSENGVIVRDDEHIKGARITLEKNTQSAPFSITCGIYGWMCHTCFFGSEKKSQEEFDLMKLEISKIVEIILNGEGLDSETVSQTVCESISAFGTKF